MLEVLEVGVGAVWIAIDELVGVTGASAGTRDEHARRREVRNSAWDFILSGIREKNSEESLRWDERFDCRYRSNEIRIRILSPRKTEH